MVAGTAEMAVSEGMRPDRHLQRHETKGFSKKRHSSLAADLEILLGDLCVCWGFCNYLNGIDLLDESGAVTAEAFAAHVLKAEGMDPIIEIEWVRSMKKVFVQRYGRAEVSLRDYAFRQ